MSTPGSARSSVVPGRGYSTTMGASAGATAFARKCFQVTPMRTATAIPSVLTNETVNSSKECSVPAWSGGVDPMRCPIPKCQDRQSSVPLFRSLVLDGLASQQCG